jgi:signal peptidase I
MLVVPLIIFAVAGGVLIYTNTRDRAGVDKTFLVTVTRGESMTPTSLEARVNDRVTITVTSDQDGEVHVHVYDIAIEAKAGQTVSRSFTADKTCTCEIEWEETSTELGSLVVSP